MYHPIPRAWLTAVHALDVTFESSIGNPARTVAGSGFWLGTDHVSQFATNRHLVDYEYKTGESGRGYEVSHIRIWSWKHAGPAQALEVEQCSILVPESRRFDVAVIQVQRIAPSVGCGRMGASVGESYLADKAFESDHLEWGAQVTFASFQAWHDQRSHKPIVRNGILASDPADEYSSGQIDRERIHLLEAMSFAGSSGCPVFANARGIPVDSTLSGGDFRPAKIIGIMAGHFPVSKSFQASSASSALLHSGLSYCHKASVIGDLIRGEIAMEQRAWFRTSPLLRRT